jgi:hypothetical protein
MQQHWHRRVECGPPSLDREHEAERLQFRALLRRHKARVMQDSLLRLQAFFQQYDGRAERCLITCHRADNARRGQLQYAINIELPFDPRNSHSKSSSARSNSRAINNNNNDNNNDETINANTARSGNRTYDETPLAHLALRVAKWTHVTVHALPLVGANIEQQQCEARVLLENRPFQFLERGYVDGELLVAKPELLNEDQWKGQIERYFTFGSRANYVAISIFSRDDVRVAEISEEEAERELALSRYEVKLKKRNRKGERK